MYCHLCRIEGSPSHENSSSHRAAKELVSVAVDRLANHVAATEHCEGDVSETEKTPKTPEAVCYCDCCNAVVPIADNSAHIRMKSHALALLDEQTFEELVQAYLSEGDQKQDGPSEKVDDGAFVDESEAAKTYTCNVCSLQVPQVFKLEHERGVRHTSSRILALAAARRASRSLCSRDGLKDCDGKFTGKMMKNLLRLYVGYDENDSEVKENKAVEENKEEPQPQTEPTRLTAKGYFTDILPYLQYVGNFHTIIIDDTEFVTIQIANQTLRVHVSNFNGLYNFEGNGGCFMNCRLCYGAGPCYNCSEHQDKTHVMSLGHIKNVLSTIDDVHLIRKVDDSYSFCALCNLRISAHNVEHHILRDACHTIALTEALQRGKEYKEDKEDLKMRIYVPPTQKRNGFMPNKNGWNVGVPQQPRSVGTLFGASQTASFGNTQAQNTFGNSQNTGIGGNQNAVFGSTQNAFGIPNTGSGTQSTFGSTQNTAFGSSPSSTFIANPNHFGGLQGVGSGQPSCSQGSIFGNNSFGNDQNNILGANQTQDQSSLFNTSKHNKFGSTQNFGTSRNQSSIFNSPPTNQNTSVFGHTQTSASIPQKPSLFGSQTAQTSSNPTNTGASQKNSIFCNNQSALLGNSQTEACSNTTVGSGQTVQSNSQKTGLGNQKNQGTFGIAQNSPFTLTSPGQDL